MKTLFRYPGAKNKLLPQIMPFIDELIEDKLVNNGSAAFCDAFVGGGSVLLEVAEKYPDIPLLCNDKDTFVFCFWSLMAHGLPGEIALLKEMVNQKPTIDLFYKLRAEEPKNVIEAAYRAVFFNRTSFSGDMRRAASPIGGKNQNSKYTVDCRYNAKKINQKIDSIHKLLFGRTLVSNDDINSHQFITDANECPEMVVYLDPPYWHKGKQLYQEYMKDDEHKQLSQLLQKNKNWILSYDNCDEILDLYNWAQVHFIDASYCIRGSKTNWHKTKEVLILPV